MDTTLVSSGVLVMRTKRVTVPDQYKIFHICVVNVRRFVCSHPDTSNLSKVVTETEFSFQSSVALSVSSDLHVVYFILSLCSWDAYLPAKSGELRWGCEWFVVVINIMYYAEMQLRTLAQFHKYTQLLLLFFFPRQICTFPEWCSFCSRWLRLADSLNIRYPNIIRLFGHRIFNHSANSNPRGQKQHLSGQTKAAVITATEIFFDN